MWETPGTLLNFLPLILWLYLSLYVIYLSILNYKNSEGVTYGHTAEQWKKKALKSESLTPAPGINHQAKCVIIEGTLLNTIIC